MDNQPPIADRIRSIHAIYCQLSGNQLRLGFADYSRQYFWLQFLNENFTESDLISVIRYLKHQIKIGERNPGALRFGNLIERLDKFEEELAMANANANLRKPDQPSALDCVKALRERRVATALLPDNTKPVSELIEELKRSTGMTP